MSFTSDTKQELSKIAPDKNCCRLAEIAGLIRFAGEFTLGDGMGIRVALDNPSAARLLITLIKEYFGSKTSFSACEPKAITGEKLYVLDITPAMNSEQILRETGILGVRGGNNYLDSWISPSITKKRCDKKAALRGIFLASGSVSDPLKTYHLEIPCAEEYTAKELCRLINSFGLKAKISVRKNRYVVYIKEAEQILDFINIIGSSAQFFKYQDAIIIKDMKNKANRRNNCEIANIDRTVAAAQKQITAINHIAETKGLDILPEKLYDTAVKRLENPDMDLTELALLFDPPLTKSGLNHRLAKIAEISSKI